MSLSLFHICPFLSVTLTSLRVLKTHPQFSVITTYLTLLFAMSPHTKLFPLHTKQVNILLKPLQQTSRKLLYFLFHSTFEHVHELVFSMHLPQVAGKSPPFSTHFFITKSLNLIQHNKKKLKISLSLPQTCALDRVCIGLKLAMEGGQGFVCFFCIPLSPRLHYWML